MTKKNKFSNSRKESALSSLEPLKFDTEHESITQRCKFNFHYLNFTPPAADFKTGKLKDLMERLKCFSEKSLEYWSREKVDGTGTYLTYYASFPDPEKMDYQYPKNVPAEARWARFRITGRFRLIGFTIPETLHGQPHTVAGYTFDKNTFYCVFIDPEHKFWLMK